MHPAPEIATHSGTGADPMMLDAVAAERVDGHVEPAGSGVVPPDAAGSSHPCDDEWCAGPDAAVAAPAGVDGAGERGVTGPWWEITRDLAITCVLLAGYAWLSVLTKRVRAVSRRVGSHVCGRTGSGRVGREARHRVDVAEILARERDTPRPMLPPSRVRGASVATEVTEPMPVLDTGPANDRDEREEYGR